MVSNMCYFPFHIWDVIPTPLTNSYFFKMVKLHHQPVSFCWFPEPLANLHLPRNGVPADLLQWKPSKFLGCSGIPLQWSQCRIADSAPTKLRGWVDRISNIEIPMTIYDCISLSFQLYVCNIYIWNGKPGWFSHSVFLWDEWSLKGWQNSVQSMFAAYSIFLSMV